MKRKKIITKDPGDYLTMAEICHELDCSRNTVYRMVSKGLFSIYYRIGSNKRYFDKTEINDLAKFYVKKEKSNE